VDLLCPYAANVRPPAVGKSAFGAYVLWRAVKEKRTVVYQSYKVKDAWVFHANGSVMPFMKRDVEALGVLDDASTVFISDSLEPPSVKAFTLLITSPKRERWKEFLKNDNATRLFFPVFSAGEIEDMRRTCYPQRNAVEVQERYTRWGGVPRYVLGRVDTDAQRGVISALTRVDLDALAAVLGADEIESDAGISHRLMHIKPRGEVQPGLSSRTFEYYELARTEVGSRFIAENIYAAMKQQAFDRLHGLLALPTANASIAKFYGDVYERHALDKLARGGRFKRVNLHTMEEDEIVIPPSSIAHFQDTAELRTLMLKGGTHTYVPRNANYTTVDAVLPGKQLVNATINTDHDLKLYGRGKTEGVIPVAEALGLTDDADIEFFWVLPRDRYDIMRRKAKPRSLTAPAGTADVAAVKLNARVKQYAVLVEFDIVKRAAPAALDPSAATSASALGTYGGM
jgi:hypothetical protein